MFSVANLMKTISRKIILGGILGFLLLFPVGLRGEVVDRIIALVNNDVLTLSELEEAGRRLFEQVQQATLPSQREEKLKKAKEGVLDQLIENKLLDQEIKKKKIEVSDRDVDVAIEDIRKENHMTENDLKVALAKDGMSYSSYWNQIRDDLGKFRLVSREIKSKIVIKDEDVQKTYQEKIKEYIDPLEVKVQQVFFLIPQGSTEERIEELRQEARSLLDRAKKGEDFADLAIKYSQGPEAREGGVLGFFKHKELIPELEEAAFQLKAGELSGIVRSPEGFHILRVLERKGGEPRPFAVVKNKIREEMIQKEAERQFKEWMKTLKAKAYIEIKL